MTEKGKTRHTPADEGLNAFFDAGRNDLPPVSPKLLLRVISDGLDVQAQRTARAPVSRTGDWRARLGEYWQALGGLPAAAVLGLCLVAGFSLGITPPDGLDRLSVRVLGAAGLVQLQNVHYTLDDLTGEG